MCQHMKEELPAKYVIRVDVDPTPANNIKLLLEPQEEPDSDIEIDHSSEFFR